MRKLRELDVDFIKEIDKTYKRLKEDNSLIDKKKICISIKAHGIFDCIFLSCYAINSKFDDNFKDNDKMLLRCYNHMTVDNSDIFYSKIVDKHNIGQEINDIKEDFIDKFEDIQCTWNCMTRHKTQLSIEDDE